MDSFPLVLLTTAYLLSFTSSSNHESGACPAISQPSCRCSPSSTPFDNVKCTFNDTESPSSPFSNSSVASPLILQTVDLSHNGLGRLPVDFFNGEIIDTLILRGNQFQDVPEVLGKLGGVRVLDLSSNALKSLSWEVLARVPGLQRLDVSENELNGLTAGTGQSGTNATGMLTSLREVRAARNAITRIDDGALEQLSGLISLDLAGNFLTRVTRNAFRGLGLTLMTLDLSNNTLTDVDALVFRSLQRLHTLSLANNSFLREVLGKLRIPQHLNTLDLQGSNLTSVGLCRFASLTDLAVLDLRGNPLNCTCDLFLLQQRFRSVPDAGNQSQWHCYRTVHEAASANRSTNFHRTPTDSFQEIAVADLQSQCKDSYDIDCPSVNQMVSQMTLALEVATSGHNLTVSWILDLSNDLSTLMDGLQVRYIPESIQDALTSDVVPPDQRSLTLETTGISAHFVVCLDVLAPASMLALQKCSNFQQDSSSSSILVGIMAGVVFLAPCVVILAYIVFKDSRISKALYLQLGTAEVDDVERQSIPGKAIVSSDKQKEDIQNSKAEPQGFSKGDIVVAVISSTVVDTTKSEPVSGESSSTNEQGDDHDGCVPSAEQSEMQQCAESGGQRNLGFLCQAGHTGGQVCLDPEHESTDM